jgi:nicotinamidase/pyrazinamidase
VTPGEADVLIVVDVQNCFVPGGTLPVKEGDAVVPVINAMAKRFANVVITQDWHTPGHASFASAYPGKKPFETTTLAYGEQVLWPDHCVQGSADAALHPALDIPHAQLVIRKGYHRGVDSYSAFYEADAKTPTGPRRLPQAARHRAGVRGGARHGLLRRVLRRWMRGGTGSRCRWWRTRAGRST